MKYIISIDQSTSATKAMLFATETTLVHRVSIEHKQYYPAPGWLEHDPLEIWENTYKSIEQLLQSTKVDRADILSISITNQRETVVVWDKHTGEPVCNAVVWQCTRGAQICNEIIENGQSQIIEDRTGLIVNPYFSASGVKWILDNVEGARQKAQDGDLLLGTIDTWLIWKLTGGKVHATDYTNASRTLLFNVHTLQWDTDLLEIFSIPASMLPKAMPCDQVFGHTTLCGLLNETPIAGVLGDSHGALVGQMCFGEGMGKATYGTGSSVMVNIGEECCAAPKGLVTSVGFAACGKVAYAFEGNIHCTGATIKWLADNLRLISSPKEIEAIAKEEPDNGGVYFVPAFAGLGAPWWNAEAKAIICGMTLSTKKGHVCRAALEAIAYQVKDLIDLMTEQAGVALKELRVDGGPTKNALLMQFQADMLNAPINRSEVEEASALGSMLMSLLALKIKNSLEELIDLRSPGHTIAPAMDQSTRTLLYHGWKQVVKLINNK